MWFLLNNEKLCKKCKIIAKYVVTHNWKICASLIQKNEIEKQRILYWKISHNLKKKYNLHKVPGHNRAHTHLSQLHNLHNSTTTRTNLICNRKPSGKCYILSNLSSRKAFCADSDIHLLPDCNGNIFIQSIPHEFLEVLSLPPRHD